MPADLRGTIETVAFLFGMALPLGLAAGGAAFVTRNHWRWSHLRSILPRHWWILALMISTLLYDILVAQLDPYTTTFMGHDFTGFFSNHEGSFHEQIQAAMPWRTFQVAIAIIYVIGFPFIVYFTTILFVWTDRPRTALRSLVGYALCLAVALPFYLFFPVQEVWAVGKAENLAPFTPWIEQHLYAFNEVNNAFPSMHTAIALVVAYVAWRSGNRRYAWFAVVLANLIIFSTFYLGIHWVLDVLGGVAVAGFVMWALDRLVPVDVASPAVQPTASSQTSRMPDGIN